MQYTIEKQRQLAFQFYPTIKIWIIHSALIIFSTFCIEMQACLQNASYFCIKTLKPPILLFFLTFSKIVQLQKNQNVQKVEDTSVNIYYTICAIVTLVRELQYEQNDQNLMFRVGCIPSLTLHITAKKIVLRKSFFNSFKVKNTLHKQIFY